MRNLIAALLICGSALPAMSQDASGARDASAKFTAALGSGDAATAGAFFAEDAVALPPGRGPLNGKAEIQRFLNNMIRSVKELKYVSEEVKSIDDATARDVGTFSFKMQNNDVNGKYLLIWTKAGGDWKIAADMWNRDSAGGGRQGGKQGAKQGGQGGARGGGAAKGGGNDVE